MCVCVCVRLDGPIRANQFADSSELGDSREAPQVSRIANRVLAH